MTSRPMRVHISSRATSLTAPDVAKSWFYGPENMTVVRDVVSSASPSELAMRVQELGTAVAEISPDELARFAKWFEGYQAELKENPRHPSLRLKKVGAF